MTTSVLEIIHPLYISKPDVKFLAIVAVILLLCAAVPLVLVPKKKMEEFFNNESQLYMAIGIPVGVIVLFFGAWLYGKTSRRVFTITPATVS